MPRSSFYIINCVLVIALKNHLEKPPKFKKMFEEEEKIRLRPNNDNNNSKDQEAQNTEPEIIEFNDKPVESPPVSKCRSFLKMFSCLTCIFLTIGASLFYFQKIAPIPGSLLSLKG